MGGGGEDASMPRALELDALLANAITDRYLLNCARAEWIREKKHLLDRIKQSLRKQFVNRELFKVPSDALRSESESIWGVESRDFFDYTKAHFERHTKQTNFNYSWKPLIISVQTFAVHLGLTDFACHANYSTRRAMQKFQCRELELWLMPSAAHKARSRSQIASQSKRLFGWRKIEYLERESRVCCIINVEISIRFSRDRL